MSPLPIKVGLALLRNPLKAHDVFVRQHRVVLLKVSLNYITVLWIFCLDFSLIDSLVRGQEKKSFDSEKASKCGFIEGRPLSLPEPEVLGIGRDENDHLDVGVVVTKVAGRIHNVPEILYRWSRDYWVYNILHIFTYDSFFL